ncbi:MAG: gas vesicle protein GvpD [Candidatus Burarchaeum sp.]|nr:ATPase domain-containing protein [Candidatus Burarchaeum sp.]MDO8339837.1 gas vesicle protein GvpD [Candidatus Burarchaeum sp.]
MADVKVKDMLPFRVSSIDELFEKRGLERGCTMLVTGGVGTGKSTFCLQSAYNSAVAGEKVIYISFEEPVEKIQKHMENNFGWDISKMVEQKRLVLMQIDPLELSEDVVNTFKKKDGRLFDIKLPFRPDRLVLDSLTALSSAFMEDPHVYRNYLAYLLRTLERANSVNLVISEARRSVLDHVPSGIEEFICDGVVQLYDIRKKDLRQNGLEILKARWSAHSRKLVPYKITNKGIEMFPKEEIFV